MHQLYFRSNRGPWQILAECRRFFELLGFAVTSEGLI